MLKTFRKEVEHEKEKDSCSGDGSVHEPDVGCLRQHSHKLDPADTGSGDDEVSTTKTLTMAIAAETTTLSPLYMGNANMCTDMLVYENLVNYENGEIVPGLAERWEFSDDGCTLTFYLRSV